VEKVRAGTLALCGAQDPATPPDLVRGTAESLPAARFELVDGAGHLPCIEQPQAMAARMNQFFEENGYG
jgi:pimeloyl-ACP methyl ester carboxylesterase